ncbi:hypothetical protein [uncultured Tenacibaculum sp.]|uniref:hypothetical protein n=1 Tax=uncultured Tenacibaculum sp. TaxID=174713 RepID=UPI00260BE4FA|nr:hypothetical protein [uncultured Tenacibaculum sp.]
MKQNKETLKKFFETGDKPTQQQYADLIDSYIDAKQAEGEANRRFVIDEAGEVSVATQLATPDYQAGTNVTIDKSNPLQPIISASGGSSTSDWATHTGSSNNGDLVLTIGDYAQGGGEPKITLNANNAGIDIGNNQSLVKIEGQDINFTNNTTTLDIDNGSITTSLTPTQINTAGNKSLITKEYADANYAGGGTTDLSYEVSTRKLVSSTGKDTILPLADATNAGLMKANFYEEGSFTPTLVDAAGGATYSSSASGKFTRIGNLVHFEINMGGINTSGTPSGDLKITGLPILASGSYASISHGFEGILGIAPPVVDAVSNYFRLSNGIEFLYKDASGNLSQVSSAVISNGTIRISGQYITNLYTP